MNENTQSLVEEFNAVIREAETLNRITRCSKLQRNAIESLNCLRSEVSSLKNEAIEEKKEDLANMFLGYECVCRTLIAELEMCILLKQENPDSAWDKLVIAQGAAIGAVRAHPGFSHLGQHYERLEAIEKLVFPPQVFMSSGMLVEHLECSICNREYEACEHLVGKPYMGEFCQLILRDIKLNHVAIVDHPADKRCRITTAHVEGGVRNTMTWRIEPKNSKE